MQRRTRRGHHHLERIRSSHDAMKESLSAHSHHIRATREDGGRGSPMLHHVRSQSRGRLQRRLVGRASSTKGKSPDSRVRSPAPSEARRVRHRERLRHKAHAFNGSLVGHHERIAAEREDGGAGSFTIAGAHAVSKGRLANRLAQRRSSRDVGGAEAGWAGEAAGGAYDCQTPATPADISHRERLRCKANALKDSLAEHHQRLATEREHGGAGSFTLAVTHAASKRRLVQRLAGRNSGSSGKLSRGDKIKAKCKGWTKHYPGTIKCDNGDDTFDIEFDDGETKRDIKRSQIEGGEADEDGDQDQGREGGGDGGSSGKSSTSTVVFTSGTRSTSTEIGGTSGSGTATASREREALMQMLEAEKAKSASLSAMLECARRELGTIRT